MTTWSTSPPLKTMLWNEVQPYLRSLPNASAVHSSDVPPIRRYSDPSNEMKCEIIHAPPTSQAPATNDASTMLVSARAPTVRAAPATSQPAVSTASCRLLRRANASRLLRTSA
jgi:hypothetical protein